jgi:hypothetical protein
VQDHLGIALDGGEHVVEVVGDATGQPADRLHLLRLGELGLEAGLLRGRPSALRDVDAHAEEVVELAILPEHGPAVPFHEQLPAVLRQRQVLVGGRPPVLDQPREHLRQRGPLGLLP